MNPTILEKDIANALEACLQQMQAGADVEQVLAQHPQLVDELRPLLRAAQSARTLGTAIQVPLQAQSLSLARTLAKRSSLPRPRARWFNMPVARFAFTVIIIIAVILAGGFGAVTASAKAIPGDPLYSLKLVTEQTRLLLTRDPAHRLDLEQTFEEERAEEIREMVNKSITDEVNLVGPLNRMAEDGNWLVADVIVLVMPGTELLGNIQPGFVVEAHGFLQPDGSILAEWVQLKEFRFTGTLHAMTTEKWLVGDVEVVVTAGTEIVGTPLVGGTLSVRGVLLADSGVQALKIEANGSRGAQPTATPAWTPTLTSSPAKAEESVIVQSPSETPEPEDDPEPSYTPEPSHTTEPSNTPAPSKTPDDGDDDDDDDHDGPSKTPPPNETREPTRTPRPPETDEPPDTPHPSYTPYPENTPNPSETSEPPHGGGNYDDDDDHHTPTVTATPG